MKQLNILAALCLMAAGALSSCSGTTKVEDDGDAAATTEVAAGEMEAEAPAATLESVVAAAGTPVVDLDNDNVLRPDTKAGRLVAIDFNATWCVPCKAFAPVFDEVANKYSSDVYFVTVDIDKCPETAKAFDVQAVPTLVLIKADGTNVRYQGTQDLLPAEKFLKIVEDNK